MDAGRHKKWLESLMRVANMSPKDFEKSLWFQSKQMFTEALTAASTCRSRGPNGELIERTKNYVIASRCLRGKIMEVVEDSVGQMKANAKLFTKRKVQKSTDSTIVQVGMKSGAKSQMLAGSGN